MKRGEPILSVVWRLAVPSFFTMKQSWTNIARCRIDELFLNNSSPTKAYRLETFRSAGSISATASQQLRCYFVTKCNFPAKTADRDTIIGHKTDIRAVSDSAFLEKATKNTLDIYQQVCMWGLMGNYF